MDRKMDIRKNDFLVSTAVPVMIPMNTISNVPAVQFETDCLQKYDKALVSIPNSAETQNSHYLNLNVSSSRNNIAAKNNSIIITNSKLKIPDQNQSLSGLVFKDKICFALPSGITWEELNALPFNYNESMELLQYTIEMNLQMKMKKKCARKNRSQSIPNNSKAAIAKKHEKTNEINISSCLAKSEVPQKPCQVHENTKKSKKSKKVALEKKINVKDKQDQHTKLNVKIDSTYLEKVKRIKVADILALRNGTYENLDIIESLSSIGILRINSPFYKDINSKSTKNYNMESEQKDIPSLMSINLFNGTSYLKPSKIIKTEQKNIPRLMSINLKKDNYIKSTEFSKVDLSLKNLIDSSWLESEDEETNSRQIYENLNDIVKDFNENLSDAHNTTQTKTVENITQTEQSEIQTNKKEKKIKMKYKKEIEKIKSENDASFEKYYDKLTVEEGLKNGILIKDILRINQKNFHEAFVTSSSDDIDIFVDGVQKRNRALDGDEVVIKLCPQKKRKIFPNNTVQKSGKVVFISKQIHPRTAVGYLMNFGNKTNAEIFLCPMDSKLPKIKIPLRSCPPDFQLNYKNYANTLFLAKIISWEKVKCPKGVIIEKIGECNDKDTERKRILYDNFLNVEPFQFVADYLPSLPYIIQEDEIIKRLDIRSHCIFTIDPPGAKDLDDALSCTLLANGNVEVGIHIADVTHFLKPNTPLDNDARQKANSIYLTETVFHMLPTELCQLCSLTPDNDKLAISLFVVMDSNANIIEHKFDKTVIRSCVQLTYSHVQDIIEKKVCDAKSFPKIINGFSKKDCVEAITRLYGLSMKMRKKRFVDGALKIEQPKIMFALDEQGLPLSYSLYIGKECNWLVEEFMLLTNILAANKIKKHFPNTALLRFHSFPKEKSLATIVNYLEMVGIYIDTTSAGSIYRSMMQYEGSDELGVARMAVITNLLVKPMVKACYVCSSSNLDDCSDYWHYALNTPFYTHFTSPIRRYADIMVHRYLVNSLGYAEVLNWTPDDIQNIADNCNQKKKNSKKASEMSTELYLKFYLKRWGPIKVRGVVIEVKERYFDIIDLSTRSTNRVFIEKIKDIEKINFEDDSMPSLKVEWKGGVLTQIIQIFTIVDIELSCVTCWKSRTMKIIANLLKPSSEFDSDNISSRKL